MTLKWMNRCYKVTTNVQDVTQQLYMNDPQHLLDGLEQDEQHYRKV